MIPPGPLAPFRDASVTNIAEVLSAGPAHLHFVEVVNPNTSDVYLQLYDTAGAVVVGTTVPALTLLVPAGDGSNNGAREFSVAYGIQFILGIKYAVTTTQSGGAAPSSNCSVVAGYRNSPSSINS